MIILLSIEKEVLAQREQKSLVLYLECKMEADKVAGMQLTNTGGELWCISACSTRNTHGLRGCDWLSKKQDAKKPQNHQEAERGNKGTQLETSQCISLHIIRERIKSIQFGISYTYQKEGMFKLHLDPSSPYVSHNPTNPSPNIGTPFKSSVFFCYTRVKVLTCVTGFTCSEGVISVFHPRVTQVMTEVTPLKHGR